MRGALILLQCIPVFPAVISGFLSQNLLQSSFRFFRSVNFEGDNKLQTMCLFILTVD